MFGFEVVLVAVAFILVTLLLRYYGDSSGRHLRFHDAAANRSNWYRWMSFLTFKPHNMVLINTKVFILQDPCPLKL